MDVCFDRKPLFPMREALISYGQDEFTSPYRSTVPLLSWLRHERRMARSLFRGLGIVGDPAIHLEYQVRPPQGRGNPSHTDLMVVAGGVALAVEAKWTEPPYSTIGEWLPTVDPVNGPAVLDGWLGLLRPHAALPLDPAAFAPLTYQMVHRAASACFAGKEPVLAYLLFTPSPRPRTATAEGIGDQLAAFRGALGNPAGFPFFVVEVQTETTALFHAIAGGQAGAPQVMAALEGDEPLFAFGRYSVRPIA